MEQRSSDVGARLRDARERRGLTLQALSHATKISVVALGAIESNDVAHLPGGLYTRGHVRAYAAEVGLNADELASAYMAQFQAPPAEVPRVHREVEVEKRPISARAFVAPLLVCGVGILIYGLFVRQAPEPSRDIPPAPPVADAVPTEGATETPATAGVAPAALATDVKPVLQLEVMPRSACWVSIRADGQVAIFRVMQRGERALIEANDTLVVNVGDAGAFDYRLNGAPGRPLGRTGQVVTVRITEATYESFLAEAPAANDR